MACLKFLGSNFEETAWTKYLFVGDNFEVERKGMREYGLPQMGE